MSRRLWTLGGGAAIYLVMVASVHPWAVVQGLAIAAAAAALAGGHGELPRGAEPQRWRLLAKLPNLLARQVLTGSYRVARVALGLEPVPRGTWVELPYGERPRVAPAALAIFETWSPGSYLVDVDSERRVLIFHVFDADDADDLRRRHSELLGTDEDDREEEA